MNKQTFVMVCYLLLGSHMPGLAYAKPSDALLQALNAQVLRVQVKHRNGNDGLGSAVVIAKNQVITNCHVVTDASNVNVIHKGVAYPATAVSPDWYHDLCMLTVADLDAPVAAMGASKHLKYETPVLTVGYPDTTTAPVNTFGVVKGLFPMDDGMIIRATSAFRLGASGGGIFDEGGKLVGIITLKSRGNAAHYYFMPVEWVQALMHQPSQALGKTAEQSFWAMAAEKRPYFMQVVQPFVAKSWHALREISSAWVKSEPEVAESWFHLAVAEFETHDYARAAAHFKQALALQHDAATVGSYLEKIAQNTSQPDVQPKQMALLAY